MTKNRVCRIFLLEYAEHSKAGRKTVPSFTDEHVSRPHILAVAVNAAMDLGVKPSL